MQEEQRYPVPGESAARAGPLSAGGRAAFTASGPPLQDSIDEAAMKLSPSRPYRSHRDSFLSAIWGGKSCLGWITFLQDARVEVRHPPSGKQTQNKTLARGWVREATDP